MANPRIDELRRRLEKEPGSRLFGQLAEELRKDGELQEAIRVCREGLQKQPNYPSARMTLGRALFDSGDLAAARAELQGVLSGAPDNLLAGRLLAECLERQGDRDGALARFKATLALAPGDKQILDRIQALEVGQRGPDASATLVMPPGAAHAPRPGGAPAPIEATLVDVPTPFEAEAASHETEPPPIPLAPVDDEDFELERPFEARATAVGSGEGFGLAGAPPAPGAGSAPEDAPPIPLSEADESFELERPYEPRASAAGEVFPPSAAAVPRPPAATDAGSLLSDLEPGAAEAPAALPTPEPGAAEGAADAELSTVTLAELYLSQGVVDKAIAVYRQVLERDPHNARAQTRLAEIEALDSRIRAEQELGTADAATDPQSARRLAIERTIAKLEALLAALRRG